MIDTALLVIVIGLCLHFEHRLTRIESAMCKELCKGQGGDP